MKICMISNADATYPYGSTIRPHYLAEGLARNGAEVLHICRRKPSPDTNHNRLRHQEHPGKSDMEILESIRERCRDFNPDLAYSHQVYTANVGIKLARWLGIPHVYDAHSSALLEDPIHPEHSAMRRKRLFSTEKAVFGAAHKVIVPSHELKIFLRERYAVPSTKIAIVKNGVDTEAFKPRNSEIATKKVLGSGGNTPIILFTNPRVFPANDMALHYFFGMIHQIERECPNTKTLIMGGGPTPEAPSKNVIYAGFVQNLSSYINDADVCVAPFPPNAVCGGTRNKVCEYMACGKAIVATEEGMRGFDDAKEGEHFLLAKNDKDFVMKVLFCIHNPHEAKRLGQNARELAERYDWRPLSKELGEMLTQVANKGLRDAKNRR